MINPLILVKGVTNLAAGVDTTFSQVFWAEGCQLEIQLWQKSRSKANLVFAYRPQVIFGLFSQQPMATSISMD